MQSVIYILAICSIGAFLFGAVHKHERDRGYAILIKRYMAAELGPKGIRVHAISPGPLATRAASGIPEFDELLAKAQEKAPARALVSIDDVGAATAFLALDAARLITGETLYIDGGYHIID